MNGDSSGNSRYRDSTLRRLTWSAEDVSGLLITFAEVPGSELTTVNGCKVGTVSWEFPKKEQCAFRRCRRLEKVARFVETNIHRPIKQCEIASLIGLSTSQFSRMFHRKVGICFQEWLREQRVRRAMELICQSDDALGTIAFAAGFGSVSSFNRSFKKFTGMSPREFSLIAI